MINFYSKNKSIFYISNFILIILYLSPCSIPGYILSNDCKFQPQITKDFIISTNHLYAFILISTIGFFTFRKAKQLKILKIYLIFVAILLEIIHYFIPSRSFEFIDLFGNLIGVVITIILFYFLKNNENFKN